MDGLNLAGKVVQLDLVLDLPDLVYCQDGIDACRCRYQSVLARAPEAYCGKDGRRRQGKPAE